MSATFDNERHVTAEVASHIPNFMQNILWFLIEGMEVPEKDHLQKFYLEATEKDGKPAQRIIHRQEAPLYIKEQVISVEKPVTATVFIWDDGENSVMTLIE